MTRAKSVRTILVADDDPQIRSMVAGHLAKQGYKILEAEDGLEAIATVRKEHPDLLVLDVMMPNMNGWEVARAVRQDPKSKEIGIVMLTAIGEHLNELTSPLHGADAMIDKPFEFGELEAKIRDVFSRRK